MISGSPARARSVRPQTQTRILGRGRNSVKVVRSWNEDEVARASATEEPIFVGEDDIDEGEILEAPMEEVDPSRSLPTPILPSQSDIDKHREDHCPYQSWCDACVEGRGREHGHTSVDMVSRGVPTVAFDYLFVNNKGIFTRSEFVDDGDTGGVNILVVRDCKYKNNFAHVVPFKGVDEGKYVVDMLVDDIKWLGFTRVILKSDNEPAIVKLCEEALKDIRVGTEVEQAMTENPPPYDSQANGQIEAAVKLVRGMITTLKCCLETRLGHRVPIRHPAMAWLVQHAALVLSYRVRGMDGRTPYHRARGRPYGGRLLGFGEVCRYKLRAKEDIPDAGDGRKWHRGVFFGISRRDGQYIFIWTR